MKTKRKITQELKGVNLSGKDAFDLGIGGLATGFGGMLFTNNREQRKVDNTELSNCVVDTAFAPDTGYFETGIEPTGMHWIIVEEYETKEDAQIGHNKWVKYMKTKPKRLYSIQYDEWENLLNPKEGK